LPICGGLFTEVVPDIWGTVIPMLWRLAVCSRLQRETSSSGEASTEEEGDEDETEDSDSESSSCDER
jgi:hypothetical protein